MNNVYSAPTDPQGSKMAPWWAAHMLVPVQMLEVSGGPRTDSPSYLTYSTSNVVRGTSKCPPDVDKAHGDEIVANVVDGVGVVRVGLLPDVECVSAPSLSPLFSSSVKSVTKL